MDSGAVYSVAPEEILVAIGIEPTSTEEFILANGERIAASAGNAYFEYGGKVRAAPVVFGATTLEALGMILDPINRQLKPLHMVMM